MGRVCAAMSRLGVALVAPLVVAVVAAGCAPAVPDGTTAAASRTPGGPSAAASPSPSPTPSPSPSPTPTPSPSPSPTPVLVPAPLTGRLVTEAIARRRPIAVMVDDLRPARPQSGFTDASVVWHAPAEGGIPRYMLVFGEGDPPSVGPVRSARHYYIAWAAEWRALYVHVGGSPIAQRTLRESGRGQLVWNADEFRWGGRNGKYLGRVRTRSAPHNVYTDGKRLRALQAAVGAPDFETVPAPAWTFGPPAPILRRPVGGRIEVVYPANTVTYRYDRATNTYRRAVTGEKQQVDAGTKQPVAPTNVVVMLVRFSRLADNAPQKGRLEAEVVGKGVAWIATNGRTTKGTWRKDSLTKPTRFFDAAGKPVVLTVGQTFVQVLRTGSKVVVVDGKVPVVPRPPGQARPA